MKASNQWKERPADERWWSVEEMMEATRAYSRECVQAQVTYGDLDIQAVGTEIALVGKTGVPAVLTNYAMAQFCQRVKAPHGYLSTLPVDLAVQNLRVGLKNQKDPDDKGLALIHKNGGLVLRCITGEHYARIWNWEIGQQLMELSAQGWRVPPARPCGCAGERTRIATEADVLKGGGHRLGLSVKVGDLIAPAGVYASDRDLFVFMVDDDHTIQNKLSPEAPLARGFFVWNSEVGDKTFGIMSFLYDAVCGNHIVWGAQEVREFRCRHVGQARGKSLGNLEAILLKYAESSGTEDEAKIEASQVFQLGVGKDEIIRNAMEFITRKKLTSLKERDISEAYQIASDNPRYGKPSSPWALTQGLTEISQRKVYTEDRVKMERDAGKLLEIAF